MTRKFFAALFVFIFAVVALPVSLFFGVAGTFLNQNFYKGEFSEEVHDFMVDVIVEQSDQVELEIEKDQLREIVDKAFKPEDLELIIDDVVDQVDNYELDETGVMKLSIPLDWLSDRSEVVAEEVARYLYDNRPKCTADSTQEQIDSLECVPAGVAFEDFRAAVVSQMDLEVFSDLPNQFSFELDLDVPQPFEVKVGDFLKKGILLVKIAMVAVMALLLGVVALIVFSPWDRVLRWVFLAVLLGAVVVTLFSGLLLFVPLAIGAAGEAGLVRVADFILGTLAVNMLTVSSIVLLISIGVEIYLIKYGRDHFFRPIE